MPGRLVAESLHRVDVAGHGVISLVPTHHSRQPPPLLRNGLMPTTHELVLDLAQLRPHPLRDGDTPQPEPPVPRLPADMRKAQEVERLRLTLAPRRPIPGG